MKRIKPQLEFRYYEMPQGQPLFALLGEKWVQSYGSDSKLLHFHNYMEIGYCYDGTGELILDDKTFPFQGNMCSIIPKNFPHTTISKASTISKWEYLFIDVENFLYDSYQDNPVFAEQLLQRIQYRAFFFSMEEQKELMMLVKDILNEMRDTKEFYQETVRGMLLVLLLRIARVNTEIPVRAHTRMHSLSQLGNALNYVSENYVDEIKIKNLSDACHMSETHFRRLFTQNMHMSPMDYVNMIRVQKACECLKKTQESMEQVAVTCGFQTISTLNRNFKRVLGMTPYQWKLHSENYESKLLNYRISALKGW